ncbi:MAG: hypothetical protein NT062_01580 [Proteobacteria bacterium]|nr:hypothetical protein [Pseudomonadota bacterium]
MRYVVLLLAIGLSLPVRAAPTVEIKAQSQVQFDKARLVEEGLAEVSGQLTDKLGGDGLANMMVQIRIADTAGSAVTDGDGKFHTIIPIPGPGEQTILFMFRGTNLIDGSELTVTTDPARAQVVLAIAVEDAPGGVKLSVTAKVDGTTTKLPLALAFGQVSDKELAPLTKLDAGTPYVVTRKAAGGAGTRRVRATFAGDDVRQPATAEATIELTATSKTTMVPSTLALAFEDDLDLAGKVTDEDGNPIPRAAVTLASGDRRLAQGATGDDGSYRFSIEGKIVGDGKYGAFGLQVQTDPGKSFIKASRSDPAVITIAQPEPVPVAYTIAAFVATGLAAGGFFLARTKPWTRFRKKPPPSEADEPIVDPDAVVVAGGLVLNKPGVMSTLRRANDDGFSGTVRDTVRGRPVPEAVVRMLLGPTTHPTHSGPDSTPRIVDEREVRTGPDGQFVVEKLPTGEWMAEVAAPGHVTEKFVVTIPHRGELRGVRIDLVPVRERVFQLYRRAAEPVLPEGRLWGVWTPRQIVDHVRARRPTPALADLTDFVEEVYFSPRLAAETILPGAFERVERAIQERGPSAKPEPRV